MASIIVIYHASFPHTVNFPAMNYSLEIEINQPRDVVGELIGDPELRKAWQPELLGIEPLTGEPGKEGSTAKIKYRMGKAVLEMKETIVANRLPDLFISTYEADKTWNRVENTFEDTSTGGTKWTFATEFRFSGLMKIMAFLVPGLFRKQSLKYMKQFKDFAEGGQAT